MPLATLAVHQLRYYLIFGAHGPARLARDGHAYLSIVEPLVLLVAAMALGAFIGRLTRTWSGEANPERPEQRLLRTWLVCALVLFALYCGQELTEGMFAPGHAAGVAGVLGHGGLIAAPLAALLGAVLTLALRTADTLLALAAHRRRAHRGPAPASAPLSPRPGSTRDWRLDPASGVVTGRAPPRVRLSAH